MVKAQESRRLQNKGRTDQPGRLNEQRALTGDEAIREEEIGGALAGAMEDQELMFDEEGLGNYGTDAARPRQSGGGREEMDERITRSRISAF